MKNLIYVFAFLGMTILVSCPKDDIIPGGNDSCTLLSSTWDIQNDPAKTITLYSYDGSENVIEIIKEEYDLSTVSDYSSRWALSYSGNKLDGINTFSTFLTDPEEAMEAYRFYYVNDLIDSISVTNFRQPISGSYTYKEKFYYKLIYNGDKLTKLVKYLTFTADNSLDIITTDLEWIGNNISKVTSLLGGEIVSTTYTYDDKNPPLRNHGLVFTDFTYLTVLSENNVVSSRYNYAGTLRGIDNTFVYNSDNFPTSITTTYISDAYTDFPIVYDYDCN